MNKKNRAIFIINEILVLNIAIFITYLIRFGGDLPPGKFQPYFYMAIILTPVSLIIFYVFELLEESTIKNHVLLIEKTIEGATLAYFLLIFIAYFLRIFSIPRSVVVISWAIWIPMEYYSKVFWGRLLKKEEENIILIGKEKEVSSFYNKIKLSIKRYNIINIYQGVKDISRIIKDIEEHDIDAIIIVSPINYREFVEQFLETSPKKVQIKLVPSLYEIKISRPDFTVMGDIPLIEITRTNPSFWYNGAKRVIDFIFSILFIIISSPLYIVIPILIKLSSKGDVIFKQERIGKGKKGFTIYKFRTMYENAHKFGMATEKNDPRITPIGRILRRFHVDELPQLFNVLKGNMSLIGPRPEWEELDSKYGYHKLPFYEERFLVNPGITGLAQIYGSGGLETHPNIKLKYDLMYVYNRSITLDFQIILMTMNRLLRGKGI